MRRIPGFVLIALAGLILVSASVLTIFTADAQVSPNPIVPTALAMLTQMPPDAVATQLAAMGYQVSPQMQATAMAMLQQGVPPQTVLEMLLGGAGNLSAPSQPTAQPTMQQPVQPTAMQPTLQPPVSQPTTQQPIVQPTLESFDATAETPVADSSEGNALESPVEPTVVPLEGADMPEATDAPFTPVPVGRISGSVTRAESADSSGINLTLTRPDGTMLNLPTGAEGLFAFSNMEAGAYALQASSGGFLSSETAFSLEAGQDLVLPAVILPAGDTNGDNLIDLADAALVAANFDALPPVSEADLNQDGLVDLRDLALLGNAYGLTGPLPWATPPA